MAYQTSKDIANWAIRIVEALDSLDTYQKSEVLSITHQLIELELRRTTRKEDLDLRQAQYNAQYEAINKARQKK